MTEMSPHDDGMDSLLRRSMAAPVPSLPADFDRRLMREVGRASEPLDRNRRILLASYGLLSVVTSVVVMRGQGLGWSVITVAIGGSVGLVTVVPLVRRATMVRLAGLNNHPGR